MGEETHFILANLWIGLIAFFLLFYAITDGADVGVGMIFPFCPDQEERDMIIGGIESTWHTNQTWLVILGGMLFGAFPLFYAIVLSALYIPIIAMLFALILRGVALDYYEKSKNKAFWGMAFSVGSLFVSVTQGLALGGLLGGINVQDGAFAGGVMDWLNPFAGLVTVGVILGFVMLGANFLILKTEGDLQRRGYRWALISSIMVAFVSAGVYAWMLAKYPFMVRKFTTTPDVYWVAPFPAMAVVFFVLYFYSLWRRFETLPFFFNAAIILFSFAGISFALYPHMIPNVVMDPVGITETAASTSTLIFMTLVMAVVLPVILIYNAYNQFWVFRGKVSRYYEKE